MRIAASMMYLWGVSVTGYREWIPDDFSTELYLDGDSVVRMIWSFAKNRFDLEEYKKTGIFKKVRIFTANDSHCCSECNKLAEKTYPISKAPELPYEKCTSPHGCRCWFGVSLDDKK